MNSRINHRLKGLGLSATIEINQKSQELEKAGRKIYKLGLGQSPFPVPERVVNELKQNAHEKAYEPVQGIRILREAVAGFHRRKNQMAANLDNVMIGPGSKELMFLLQLVFNGEIILPTPCWVSYEPQAKILGHRVRKIHTTYDSGWRITPEQINQVSNTNRNQLLILNYPGNPDGQSYSSEELKEIAAAAKKKRVLILSDEIYGELHHQGKHESIARYYPEGTIISSGLSKWCGAGGWRLGTFTFPENLKDLMIAMCAAGSETYTSVSSPIQYAAAAAFKGGEDIERYLAHARRILSKLGNEASDILEKAKVKVHRPKGGFYLFLDFSNHQEKLRARGITTSKDLTNTILKDTGVATLPGSDFLRPKKELTARIAYVDFDGSKTLVASQSIGIISNLPDNFTKDYCPKVIEAMELIANWLKQ